MPPRPKYTREEIIEAAYELARKQGIDAVAARAVGKSLNTSATPIFTFFKSMDELKAEVYNKAKAVCFKYMDGLFDYTPAFKEFGMRWIRFATEEPALYKLLFIDNHNGEHSSGYFPDAFYDIMDPLLREVEATFSLSKIEATLLLDHLLIYANGIASGGRKFKEEELNSLLSQICIGLVISARLRDGSFEPHQAKAMAESAMKGIIPQKKKTVK